MATAEHAEVRLISNVTAHTKPAVLQALRSTTWRHGLPLMTLRIIPLQRPQNEMRNSFLRLGIATPFPHGKMTTCDGNHMTTRNGNPQARWTTVLSKITMWKLKVPGVPARVLTRPNHHGGVLTRTGANTMVLAYTSATKW